MPQGVVATGPIRKSMALAKSRYREAVLASGPVVYYGLDEPAGATTAVDRRGVINGTYVGSPSIGRAALPTVDGSAVLFDGINDAVTFAAPFFVSNAAWTIECLVLPSALTQDAVIVCNGYPNSDGGGNANHGWGIGIGGGFPGQTPGSGSTLCMFESSPGDQWGVTDYDFVSTKKWVHIVVSHIATTFWEVIVDGVGVDINIDVGEVSATPATVASIGAVYDTDHATLTGFFSGYIDEVAVYNKRLSLATAQLHHEIALGLMSGLH